jgi:hypothetical protein
VRTQNIDVCLNPSPERYPGKFLAIHNDNGGVFVSSSNDGKTFNVLWDKAAIPYHSDTHNNFVYDEERDRWLLFCRARAWAGDHKRRVSVRESRNLEDWTHERTILIPTETETPEFYGMPVFRRGDLFFGLLQIYDRKTGRNHVELAWSGDGVHWDQLLTHPVFLGTGAAGSWDHSMVYTAESPVEAGDELRFYYGGRPLGHDVYEDNIGGLGMAVSERDRLIGVRPSGKDQGTLLTRPFDPPPGGKLVVNARVRGKLTAELRNDFGKVLEGFSFAQCTPVTSTGFEQPMSWGNKNLGDVVEKDVRIAFRLDDAELFTFDFAADSKSPSNK